VVSDMSTIDAWMRQRGRGRLVSGQPVEEPDEATEPEPEFRGFATPGARTEPPKRVVTPDDLLRGERRGGQVWERIIG
jgi:hypothetical protein